MYYLEKKYVVLFLLILLILLFSLQFCSESNKNERKELCYIILKLDKENNIGISENEYKLLDKLLEIAEQNIKPKRNYNFNETISILNQIARIHKIIGIKTPLRRSGEPLSIALKEKSFDCENYVVTYLSIAQKLKLPLRPVFAPKHIFLEWNDGKNCFFWETLYNIVKTKEEYINDHFIPEKTIKDGIYLTPINNEKLIANYYNTLATYFLFEKNDFAKSYFCLMKAYYSDTLSPEIMSNFGNYYMKQGGDGMILYYYSKALSLNQNYFSTYMNRGVYYLYVKKYMESIIDLKKALSFTKDSIEKSNTYFNIGMVYKTIGDLSKAKALYDSAICYNSVNEHAYNDRGYCYFKFSKYDYALSDYNISIKLNPNYSLYYSNRASIKILLSDSIGALSDFCKAISLDKNNFNAIMNRARLYLDKMEFKNALLDLNKAIELDSTIAGLFYYRAITNVILGNNSVSDKDYSKYISMLKPQNDEDYFSELIWFQLISRKYKEAIQYSIEATSKFPKNYYLKSYLALFTRW